MLSEHDWHIRLAIYRHFIEHERPPTYQEIANQVGLPAEEARLTYRRLHDHHAIFLDPGTDTIRIANPLSAISTQYRVVVQDHHLWANCAWDSLGIPAMLHADARIEAVYAHSGDPVTYNVTAGQLNHDGGIVHFALPFRQWYDDLIRT